MQLLTTSREASFVLPDEGKVCNVFSSTITIKIRSEMTNSAYSVSENAVPPGAGAPPHIHHRELETFIVLEGEFEFHCGDRKFVATKGAMVVLPKEIPHSFKNVRSAAGKALLILVPGGAEKVFEEINAMPPGGQETAKINAVTMKYGIEFLPTDSPGRQASSDAVS